MSIYTLALPMPSWERDLAKAQEEAQRFNRAQEINRKAQKELDQRIENFRRFGTPSAPRWTITVHNVTSTKTRLYFVSSTLRCRDGSSALTQSVLVADSEAQAKRMHRKNRKENPELSGAKELIIAAFCPGDWSERRAA